jgi:Leucine-rich repeat (LRR) protein
MLAFEEFPNFVFNNPNLKVLDLRLTYFKDVPPEINKLSNLTTLTISFKANKLPDEFYALKNLKYLWLNSLNLETAAPLLDPQVFPNLEVLKIKDTGISKKEQAQIYQKRPNLETLWKPWDD